MSATKHGRLTAYLGLLVLSALAAGRSRAQPSLVRDLPVPAADGEWQTIAISPAGDRVYFGNYARTVAVIDADTEALLDTFELPMGDADWIGGLAVTPSGRLLVASDAGFYALDASDGSLLEQVAVPWAGWWEGPMVLSPDGSHAYVASVDEIFVVETDPLRFVDTIPGGDIDGLAAANPGWTFEYRLSAYHLEISPDGDRLYVATGHALATDEYPLRTIDGLSGSSDFTGLILTNYVLPNTPSSDAAPRIALSADGASLYDTHGNVWRTSDMTVVAPVHFEAWPFWEASLVAPSPEGTALFFQGWGTASEGGTYDGESLLVVSTANYEVVDLDDDPLNGITGIDMPQANGWGASGAYNGREWVISPDGDKLFMACGNSGALSISLTSEAVGGAYVRPNRGGNDGEVTVRIAGIYTDGTTAYLERGETRIDASHNVSHTSALEARFDLTDRAWGDYDIVIVPPGGDSPTRIANGFRIEEAREAAAIEMVGNDTLLFDGETTVRVIVQNTGNVDLRDVVVTLELADDTRYKLNLPPAHSEGMAQVDDDFTTAEAPEMIWLDRLTPSASYTFELTVAGPTGVPPPAWGVSIDAKVGYLTADDGTAASSSSGALSGARSEPLIGELCSVGGALTKALGNELRRRGTGASDGDITDAAGRVVRDAAIDYGVSKISGLVAKGLTLLVVAAVVPAALPIAATVFGTVSDLKSCYDFASQLFALAALFSFDPNDKLSSTGIDGYLMGNETLRYLVRFENLPEATAAAQTVVITDELDADLDLRTFELVGTSHPEALSHELNTTSRTLTFTFTGIDLPPNATPPEGQGYVEFLVHPRHDLPDGTIITNSASIVFDLNEPIVTPEVRREIDLAPPLTVVDTLADTMATSMIPLHWSASDTGVGVWDYSVFVSVDDGPFVPWLENTEATSAAYAGEAGHRYRFYVRSRDRLDNQEMAGANDAVETRVVDGGGCGCHSASAEEGRPILPWTALVVGAVALMWRRKRRT